MEYEVSLNGWKPISTAPKDGTVIMVCGMFTEPMFVWWWKAMPALGHKAGWYTFTGDAPLGIPEFWKERPRMPEMIELTSPTDKEQ